MLFFLHLWACHSSRRARQPSLARPQGHAPPLLLGQDWRQGMVTKHEIKRCEICKKKIHKERVRMNSRLKTCSEDCAKELAKHHRRVSARNAMRRRRKEEAKCHNVDPEAPVA